MADETINRKARVPWNKGKTGLQVGWLKGKRGRQPWMNTDGLNKGVPWNKGLSGIQIGHWRGKKLSTETRLKLSAAHKGQKPWNKGIKMPEISGENHPRWKGGVKYQKKPNSSHVPWNTGKKLPFFAHPKAMGRKVWNAGLRGLQTWMNVSGLNQGQPWNKGRKMPEISGEKHPHWNGGSTLARQQIRKSIEYKAWRTSVFQRDNFTCQFCGDRGVTLHADHIKPFATHPELRFDLANGRTLCVPCHKNTDTFAGRTR